MKAFQKFTVTEASRKVKFYFKSTCKSCLFIMDLWHALQPVSCFFPATVPLLSRSARALHNGHIHGTFFQQTWQLIQGMTSQWDTSDKWKERTGEREISSSPGEPPRLAFFRTHKAGPGIPCEHLDIRKKQTKPWLYAELGSEDPGEGTACARTSPPSQGSIYPT